MRGGASRCLPAATTSPVSAGALVARSALPVTLATRESGRQRRSRASVLGRYVEVADHAGIELTGPLRPLVDRLLLGTTLWIREGRRRRRARRRAGGALGRATLAAAATSLSAAATSLSAVTTLGGATALGSATAAALTGAAAAGSRARRGLALVPLAVSHAADEQAAGDQRDANAIDEGGGPSQHGRDIVHQLRRRRE